MPTCFTARLAIVVSFLTTLTACKARNESNSSTLLAVPTESQPDSPFEYFRPNNWVQFGTSQFQRMTIDGAGNIFSVTYLEFARLTGAYGLSVQKESDGAYKREDRWKLTNDILPGTLLLDGAAGILPIALRLRAGREVTYTRIYPDKMSAIKSLPRSPTDLPLTAAKASSMRPGDFVSLPVSMGLALGLETGRARPPFAVSASTGVFWNGEFRINIYRQDKNFVRIKVAPSDDRGYQFSTEVSAGLNMFGYGPFGFVNLDRQAERFLGFDFFRFAKSRVTQGEKMAFDYVLNLDDASARIAYDSVMQSTVKLKVAVVGAQAFKGEVDEQLVLADLTPLEYLNQADDALDPAKKRVARVFRGARYYSGITTASQLGPRLLRWQSARSFTFNWMSFVNGNSDDTNVLNPVFNVSRKQNSWISPLREQQELTAAAVFLTDPAFKQQRFMDLGFEWSTSQSDLDPNERNDIKAAIQVLTGPEYERMNLERGMFGSERLKKFKSRLTINIKPELLAAFRMAEQKDHDRFEKNILYVVILLTDRFKGRYGPMSSGEAANLLGVIRNFQNNTLQVLQSTTRSLVHQHWEGVRGQTIDALINATLNINRTGELEYVSQILRLMEKDFSAEEIAPAFLLTFSEFYQIPFYVSMTSDAAGQQPFAASMGEDTGYPARAQTAKAFYGVTHLGYER